MNARELSIRVRDGLLLLEQQEAGQPETLTEELEQEANASLRTVQNLIDAMARQRRLWLANGMNLLIANPLAEIPGTFSRARWLEIEDAFNALEAFMTAPLPVCGVPPLVVVSRRGNPPGVPAPEPPPEQAQTDAAPPEVVIVGEIEGADEAGTKGAKRGKRN
jgi:hypothetical protein